MTKLKPGLKTYYRGKIAYVVECINESDPNDIRLQGRRWYADCGGYRFSVTETELHENRWG